MANIIKVGMADLEAAKAPDCLMTSGLGSCVGICLYDPIAKIGGLAHIMLPNSKQAKNADNKAKFADTAIPVLLEKMLDMGAGRRRLVAKIAGGAQMFNFAGATDVMRIGDRNAEAVVERLKEERIPIIYQDTGGHSGRTIKLFLEDGKLSIRTLDQGEKVV